MAPRIFSVTAEILDAATIQQAAHILRSGGLVVFPTETVYGLGADATNPQAIERLNRVKGRPADKPYSWHLACAEKVRSFLPDISPLAKRLMDRFWPGPLTIVLSIGEGRTIGFRVPDHPVAQAFLKACDVPVAAPSANRSGNPPPTNVDQVLANLNGSVDGIVDSGPTAVGRESTVVRVVEEDVEILRQGAIDSQTIRSLMFLQD